jgi:hypothetical protein
MKKPKPMQVIQGNITAPKLVSTEINAQFSANQSVVKMKQIHSVAARVKGTTIKELINDGRA